MCRWIDIFQKLCDPIVITLLAPGEKCHLDFSPKSCTYPSLVTTNPLEVKIISILLYKNNNFPTLFCTFTIDNSSFLTTIKKKMWEKEINSKCFPFWNGCTVCLAQLTFMALYLSHCDVTAWQTWSNKPLQYLGMKL